MTLSESFGLLDPEPDEVELHRTNDLWNIDDPNWTGAVKNFELGMQNADATVMSNMISKKLKNKMDNSWLLSDLLQVVTSTQMAILKLIEKLFGNEEVKKDA